MPTIRHPLALTLLPALVLGVVTTGCDDDDDDGSGLATEEFRAELSGENEVPPVTTPARGSAVITAINDTSFNYTITTADGMTGVIQAHIHSGSAGENGPIRVFLFGPEDPPVDVPGGPLVTGTIRAGDVDGITYAELLDQIRNRGAYVNVHTQANPAGEIRGQLDDED